jgi:hypothetical protein
MAPNFYTMLVKANKCRRKLHKENDAKLNFTKDITVRSEIGGKIRSIKYLMVLSVRMRIQCGMGRFCLIFFASFFLILNVLWDGCNFFFVPEKVTNHQISKFQQKKNASE